jgi:hypothetical protein
VIWRGAEPAFASATQSCGVPVVEVRKATRRPSGESEGAAAERAFRKRAMSGHVAPASPRSPATAAGTSSGAGVGTFCANAPAPSSARQHSSANALSIGSLRNDELGTPNDEPNYRLPFVVDLGVELARAARAGHRDGVAAARLRLLADGLAEAFERLLVLAPEVLLF